MVICDRPGALGERIAAADVRDLLLDLVGAGVLPAARGAGT